MSALLPIIASSVLLGLAAQTLSGWERRVSLRKQGLPQDARGLIRWLDLCIIAFSAALVQVCLMPAAPGVLFLGGAFGAFLAAAAWADARTGWVPDVVIAPALILGLLLTWSRHAGAAPDPLTGLLIGLCGVALFGALILMFIMVPGVTTTPPDAVFALAIIMTPRNVPQMFVILGLIMGSVLLVKLRPGWVRALIPHEERARLTDQMDEALDQAPGHLDQNGWYPLGPIALACVLAGFCANALM